MALKVAIHGMGVIGRELLRTLWEKPEIEINMLSDLVQTDNLAYLLKYDTIYHDWRNKHEVSAGEDKITIDGKDIPLYSETEIRNLPIGGVGADLVIDCSGKAKSRDELQGFIDAGAKMVMTCYYIGNDINCFAYGVNHDKLTNENTIFTFAPMETQVLANTLKPIHDLFGVNNAIVKAFRSYTNAQPSIDSYDYKSFARGRAAAWNITPTSDVMGKNIGLVIPELNSKVIGFAYRAPVINGSVLDIAVVTEKRATQSTINAQIKDYYGENKGVCCYNEEPLCSSDAMSFDLPQFLAGSTMVNNISDDMTMLSLSVVYDSVRGYCNLILNFLLYSIYNVKGWI